MQEPSKKTITGLGIYAIVITVAAVLLGFFCLKSPRQASEDRQWNILYLTQAESGPEIDELQYIEGASAVTPDVLYWEQIKEADCFIVESEELRNSEDFLKLTRKIIDSGKLVFVRDNKKVMSSSYIYELLGYQETNGTVTGSIGENEYVMGYLVFHDGYYGMQAPQHSIVFSGPTEEKVIHQALSLTAVVEDVKEGFRFENPYKSTSFYGDAFLSDH